MKVPTKYLAHIGRKGGAVTGPSKKRGGHAYYSRIRHLGIVKARKAKELLHDPYNP